MVAAATAVTDILQHLFRTPPPEFVAERNRVVKALRADGNGDLASTVTAVRRPGVSDWALNVAAADHADEVAEMVEAAVEVIDAQEAAMDGRDGGDLRVRLKLLRVCTATVATLASGIARASGQTGSGSSVADITTRLMEIAANRGALQLFERGLLGAEDPGSADPFAVVGSTGVVASKATAPSKRADVPTAKQVGKAPAQPSDARPTAAERKQYRAAVADAKKVLATAETAVDAAQGAVAKQEGALAKAGQRVSEAEARLEALKEAVAGEADELESARARHDAAVADVEAAVAALAAAERALDD